MGKNNFIFLVIISIFLQKCDQIKIKEKGLSGQWIIDKAIYKNSNIVVSSKTTKLIALPDGYAGKNILEFDIDDSTVVFPGINTEDISCKWKIKDKKLIISFDTIAFENDALLSLNRLKIESMLKQDTALKRVYTVKRDSILKTKSIDVFKLPLSIYAGTYTIKKTQGSLFLTSSTTKFELLNLDDIIKRKVDQMLKNR